MPANASTIEELVQFPRESLATELKTWINPDVLAEAARIVKACLAMRNQDGGFILIGFNNQTGAPEIAAAPADVRERYHQDKIQGLVTKYASEPFEIWVHFAEREGVVFPVIEVQSGVRTPVAAKSDMIAPDKSYLVREHQVYVRSLAPNNTPSTASASWKDWPRVVETCFENREADIGRFLRRHLVGVSPQSLREFADAVSGLGLKTPEPAETVRQVLEEGDSRFRAVLSERSASIRQHGTSEVACVVDGAVPAHQVDRVFLRLLTSSNPNLTGWPVWLDTDGFRDASARPYVFENGWEAFILSVGKITSDHLDFWRVTPSGRFYHRRALQDDFTGRSEAPKPMTVLDPLLAILRVAETIAVAIEFAKALGCDQSEVSLTFAFRWRGLRARELSSWANPNRHLSPGRTAYQDEVESVVSVPLSTPASALGEYVQQAIAPLLAIFDGFAIGSAIVDDLVQRLLERRL